MSLISILHFNSKTQTKKRKKKNFSKLAFIHSFHSHTLYKSKIWIYITTSSTTTRPNDDDDENDNNEYQTKLTETPTVRLVEAKNWESQQKNKPKKRSYNKTHRQNQIKRNIKLKQTNKQMKQEKSIIIIILRQQWSSTNSTNWAIFHSILLLLLLLLQNKTKLLLKYQLALQNVKFK